MKVDHVPAETRQARTACWFDDDEAAVALIRFARWKGKELGPVLKGEFKITSTSSGRLMLTVNHELVADDACREAKQSSDDAWRVRDGAYRAHSQAREAYEWTKTALAVSRGAYDKAWKAYQELRPTPYASELEVH